MSSTYEEVKAVVADLLKVDPEAIKPESRFVENLGADSMKSVELVAALEEAFDIEMDDEDALKIKTVGDASTFVDSLID